MYRVRAKKSLQDTAGSLKDLEGQLAQRTAVAEGLTVKVRSLEAALVAAEEGATQRCEELEVLLGLERAERGRLTEEAAGLRTRLAGVEARLADEWRAELAVRSAEADEVTLCLYCAYTI